MKVTKQELYLVGFFHLANLAKDPFEAFIMNDMFKDQFIDLTKHRRDTLAFFTNEDSSFYTRCEGMGLKEGEPGDKLLKQVQEFADQMQGLSRSYKGRRSKSVCTADGFCI